MRNFCSFVVRPGSKLVRSSMVLNLAGNNNGHTLDRSFDVIMLLPIIEGRNLSAVAPVRHELQVQTAPSRPARRRYITTIEYVCLFSY